MAAAASLKSAARESTTTSLILFRLAPLPPGAAPPARPPPAAPPASAVAVAFAVIRGSILSSASISSSGVPRPFSTKTLSVEGAAWEGGGGAEAEAAEGDADEGQGRLLLVPPLASWASLRTGGSPFSEQSHRAEPSSPPSSSGSCAVRRRRRQSCVLPAVASPFCLFVEKRERRRGRGREVERGKFFFALSFFSIAPLSLFFFLLSQPTDDFRHTPDGDPAAEQRVQVRAAQGEALRGRRGAEVAEAEGEEMRRHLFRVGNCCFFVFPLVFSRGPSAAAARGDRGHEPLRRQQVCSLAMEG